MRWMLRSQKFAVAETLLGIYRISIELAAGVPAQLEIGDYA
jgi:hypothetical protein